MNPSKEIWSLLDWTLLVFTTSMLLRDLSAIASLRSFRVFAKFWRIFRFANHLLMSGSLVIRLLADFADFDCVTNINIGEACNATLEDIESCICQGSSHGLALVKQHILLKY